MDPRDGLTDFYGRALSYFDKINEDTIERAWGLFAEHRGLVTSLLALFLIIYFLWGALGRSHISIQDMAITGCKVALAYAFIMSWSIFHEDVGKLILETPDQLGAALSSRMAGIAGGDTMADQVRQVGDKVYIFVSKIVDANSGGWIGPVVGTLYYILIVGFGLIPMMLILTGVTLFAKMIVAVMLAVGPIAILCNFFGITKFVFEGWLKGIAYGIFAILFTYVIAGFCFGFVRSYLDSIDIAMATNEGSLAVAAGLVVYMLVVAFFVLMVPNLAQSFAYGTTMGIIQSGGGVVESLKAGKEGGSKVAAAAMMASPAGIVGGAAKGGLALAGDTGRAGAYVAGRTARGSRAMGRMLANRMRNRGP
ncbi:MAG: type IV secretion system protein [Rhizobiaceae bacterium]|nr:type IV secretion system protein [Rhizobiaceae bacterium]